MTGAMFERGILALLKEDHKQVRARLAKLLETEGLRAQQNLRDEIVVDLRVHSRLEEEIFYPAVERLVGGRAERSMVLRSFEEHDLAEKAIEDLLEATPGTAEFHGRAQALAQLVAQHADEEESTMFKHVKRNMDRQRLEALGEQAERRKAELMGDAVAELRAATQGR